MANNFSNCCLFFVRTPETVAFNCFVFFSSFFFAFSVHLTPSKAFTIFLKEEILYNSMCIKNRLAWNCNIKIYFHLFWKVHWKLLSALLFGLEHEHLRAPRGFFEQRNKKIFAWHRLYTFRIEIFAATRV
jgi:hypothetical protein